MESLYFPPELALLSFYSLGFFSTSSLDLTCRQLFSLRGKNFKRRKESTVTLSTLQEVIVDVLFLTVENITQLLSQVEIKKNSSGEHCLAIFR